MENNKSCLAVVFYLGERRISLDEQVDDNLFFLKQQLAHLSYFRHNLDFFWNKIVMDYFSPFVDLLYRFNLI